MHRGRGEEEHDATTWDRQGTGLPVEAGRGGGAGVRMEEAFREKSYPWTVEPWGRKGPDCAGRGRQRRGN